VTFPLTLAPSPHVASGAAVNGIMVRVALALLPAVGVALWQFGLAALATLAVAVAACLATEAACAPTGQRLRRLGDGSVLVTGLLYGMVLPPALPLWMTALGAVFGVGVGKTLFGGLGANPFNPALVGRAFLQAAFPAAMTAWTLPGLAGRFAALPETQTVAPFAAPTLDGWTGATPLAAWKFDGDPTALADLALGTVAGSTGETGALALLAGGLWLAVVRVIDWRIPVAILAVTGGIAAIFHALDPARWPDALFTIGSGGLLLGAWFMATDPVASPATRGGRWLYGALIGVLVMAIRFAGGLPEGVMYAILFANAVGPHLDRLVQPRPYGAVGARSRP
jgi:electron transport complex protein RnfD